MSFKTTDAIRRVHIHYGLQALAQGAGGIFVLAFLLKAGVSVPMALLFQAALVCGRLLVRPAVLPLAKRWGVKPLLMAGTLVAGAAYPLLSFVDGVGPILFVVCGVSSVGYLLYWLNYHAYFAALGTAEVRGSEVGRREAMVALVGIVAPLLGAWGLTDLGPKPTFLMVGLIQASAIIPLIGAPTVAVPATVPIARPAWMALGLMVGDGLFASAYHFVWLIALFVTLGESFAAFGGAAAAAAVVGAVSGLVLGKHIDMGHGRRSAFIAYGAAAIVVALRAAGFGLPWLAVIANALGALLVTLVTPVLMTPVYNLAKASPCVLRFHSATEGAWDIGCTSGLLIAAGLTAAGLPLSIPILLALLAAAGLVSLLARYYGRGPA
jgi:hypothetical protein